MHFTSSSLLGLKISSIIRSTVNLIPIAIAISVEYNKIAVGSYDSDERIKYLSKAKKSSKS